MNTVQANRLLRVAQSLRESEHPNHFHMDEYVNECGTPACALGHYAARPDLQRTFSLRRGPGPIGRGPGVVLRADQNGMTALYSDAEIQDHFGIDWQEARDLFGGWGCENAQTPIQAANYIEKFVKKKGFGIEDVE